MKFPYLHISRNINELISIEELSLKLFQLGHEHEIENNIFDMEFTPNRGDCLSLRGILRELNLFYEIKDLNDLYLKEIKPLPLSFINNAVDACNVITFLKIEIEEIPNNYVGVLKDYFDDLSIGKNNFFTDISNYISYETGQPTHCYDSLKITNNEIILDYTKENHKFCTLLNKVIEIEKNNLVFFNDNKVINLAGVVGGEETSCSSNTNSVIIECASFNPELIIGKTVKYDIKSDAAYKFERGVDPYCHENILRRFIKIVEDHTKIKDVQIFSKNYLDNFDNSIKFNSTNLNKIIGSNLQEQIIVNYLTKLGFTFNDSLITIPSYRNDVQTENDISEEIARAIGYDNIERKDICIGLNGKKNCDEAENNIKKLLINNGFHEVINNPFCDHQSKNSIFVDNPLDSSKKFIRTNLKNSLIQNLLYNERRQKDCIKLFEVSDVYTSLNSIDKKRVIGIIASGRVAKNYQDFSKKIDNKYITSIFKNNLQNLQLHFEEILRSDLDSKLKNHISYIEFELPENFNIDSISDFDEQLEMNFHQYNPISDFPSSTRDLSFSVKDSSNVKLLSEFILGFKHELLKEVFIFDFYNNEKKQEIKIGFRLIFQSMKSTITDEEVNIIMDDIIKQSATNEKVSIPGLK